ncbi:MAG: hypothetical protein ACOCQP_03630 [Lentisphaeria bacterium]
MNAPHLNRHKLYFSPLAERRNKIVISRDCVRPSDEPGELSSETDAVLDTAVAKLWEAQRLQRPRVLAFGAHAVKNGLAPVIIELIRSGWITHLATNGAGVIHDWEFAYQGASSEDVRTNIAEGKFGMWEETGFNINLALVIGAYQGRGYGEAVGSFIAGNGMEIPADEELVQAISAISSVSESSACYKAAAAADLLGLKRDMNLPDGTIEVQHPWHNYSVQKAAFDGGVPCTAHPMFGHDIIYTHPMNCGAAIGRTAERDFLSFATTISQLENGVYLSVGSAVMSPMIFEKAFSMARNLAVQKGESITDHTIIVVDLAKNSWDWSKGEPPVDRPEYYMRYCKTFNRMGGDMHYASADNRDFLLSLLHRL